VGRQGQKASETRHLLICSDLVFNPSHEISLLRSL
jgi:hypothetical protein